MRAVLAVVAGYALWTVLWLGGGAALGAAFPDELEAFTEGEALTDPAYLGASLVLSFFCSLLGGFAGARIARERARGAVLVLALLLLATGLGVQLSVWELMPVWYHLVFLAALVPLTLLGGRRQASRS